MNNILNIKILLGIPGSGKSSWARKYVAQNRNIMRISRDDMRHMLVEDIFTDGNDNLINNAKLLLIKFGIDKDRNIILDDTHCYNDYLIFIIDYIRKTAQELNKNIEIEILDFDTPIDKCIERNNNRTGINKIPNHIIYHMVNEKRKILIDKLNIDRFYKIK